MATKKKPAPKKKPAAKPSKPAAKPAAKSVAKAAPVDDSARRELDAARAQIERLSGELKLAHAERDKWRSDHDHVGQKAQGHQAELEKLRAETLKGSVDVAAANRRADEAARRADERERERARLGRELDAARVELGGYKLRCPKCGKNFVEENYEGITIDRCTGCDAIYFDAGEVDQLLAKVAEKTMGPSADPAQTSGWFRGLFKRKPKGGPPTGDSPPSA
jgi:Zn-finger nucleic acid-binding protein